MRSREAGKLAIGMCGNPHLHSALVHKVFSREGSVNALLLLLKKPFLGPTVYTFKRT